MDTTPKSSQNLREMINKLTLECEELEKNENPNQKQEEFLEDEDKTYIYDQIDELKIEKSKTAEEIETLNIVLKTLKRCNLVFSMKIINMETKINTSTLIEKTMEELEDLLENKEEDINDIDNTIMLLEKEIV